MWKTNTLINLNICFRYGLTKFFTFNFTADANMDRDGNKLLQMCFKAQVNYILQLF